MEFLRSFRIGPFAIFDFAISYIAMYFIAPHLSRLFALIGINVTKEQWLWLTLPIALATHLLTKTNTALTEIILDPSGGWIAKAVILIMLLMVYVRRGNRKNLMINQDVK